MSSIKFVAGQGKCINQYKNQRVKVQKCFADMYFNRKYPKQGVIPKYAHMKVASYTIK